MSQPSDPRTNEPRNEPHANGMEELLQALWTKNYGILQERLGLIRIAEEKLAGGSLDAHSRSDAESAAHKLAGILGTFGLSQGSALASKIEALLAPGKALDTPSARQLKTWLDELEVMVASHP